MVLNISRRHSSTGMVCYLIGKIPVVHVNVVGLGVHCPAAALHVNSWVVEPPGNAPLEQVACATVFDVDDDKPELAPAIVAAGQPKRKK